MSNILVIEDDAVASAYIQAGLNISGHQVTMADRPSVATEILKTKSFDVIILDIGLPEINGNEFASSLRAHGYRGHILVLSGRNTPEDIIAGLDAGADDYMTKPYHLGELQARVRTMLRRKQAENLILTNGGLKMDLIERSVSREGKIIELTSREFNLLEFLMRHRDQVVDRSSIARSVWGAEFDPDSNVIDVYINHLRKKIDASYNLKLLKTVVGQGYVLNSNE